MKSLFVFLLFTPYLAQSGYENYRWRVLGTLEQPRHRFGVAQISNDELIVVGGIINNNNVTNSTEILNVKNGRVKWGSSMNEAHSECELLLLPNNNLLIVSGTNGDPKTIVTSAIEEFDVKQRTWRYLGSLKTPRRQHSAILINEKEILVTGGRDKTLQTLRSTEIFNIETGKSREVGDLPIFANNGKLSKLRDGTIIFFGGRSMGDRSSQTELVYYFDTSNSVWKELSSLPRATSYPSITTLYDGRIIISGGKYERISSFLKEVFIEDKGHFVKLANMLTERHGGYVEQVDSHTIITFGGFNNSFEHLSSCEFISLKEGSVTAGPSMRVPHSRGQAIDFNWFYDNGKIEKKIIVISGTTTNDTLTPAIEIFEKIANPISGTINTYTPVLEFENSCSPAIQVRSSLGFSSGDKVMIIQMQGAEINSTNSREYGEIIDYNNCGSHEFSRIASIQDNIIYLQNQLLNNYSISGKTQLIRVPEYKNATITEELTCKEWNGESGGVLALIADTLVMQSNINSSGKGFRGAKAISSKSFPKYFVTDYYDTFERAGYCAAKGEGICGYGVFPNTHGRGAPANGGGGGNNHNAGGGGGANAGYGGSGGYGWNSGNYTGNYKDAQGLGGRSIELSKSKIFMGGGGGAGHTNQETLGNGGNGGGIVILQTELLISNGFGIFSDGNSGISGVEDGAGGGGAGGSIYLGLEAHDNLHCSASGGKGGDINLPSYPVAPGGGGGGGIILLNKSEIPLDVNIKVNEGREGNCIVQKISFGAEKGTSGTVRVNSIIPENLGSYYYGKKTLPNFYYKVYSISLDRRKVFFENTTSLCPGDKVLIIQMQGAEIVTNNKPEYGKVLSLNSAGNYEFARIASATNNYIVFDKPLIRSYDPSAKVQIVTVPEYENLTITSPLSCTPWNGDTGGILTFAVEGTFNLNADIDVSSKGFRGGRSINSLSNPSTHTYDYVSYNDSTKFSLKGEGIYGWNNPDQLSGRGAAASGGGGGNNHNAGGGGGSNAGCGGNGGYGWSLFNGNRENAQGLGGYSNSVIENKIFLGGGGGAGHSNENSGTDGGNGGGIALIQADVIISDNKGIFSRGQKSKDAPFDGVGGGGAGGTVIIDCERIVNSLTIDVRGGSGGSTTEHRDGPGGGGGGGLVCLTTLLPLNNYIMLVEGGGSGTNRDFDPDGASNGCPGSIKYDVTIPGDTTILSSFAEIISIDEINRYSLSELIEQLRLQSNDENEMYLSDILGRKISLSLQSKSALPKGMYFLITKRKIFKVFHKSDE